MNSLTLDELDDDLIAAIRRVAEGDNSTENEAALKLLRKGAELEDVAPANGKVGKSLDEFIGTMSPEEAAEIDAAVRELRTVDKSMWR